jgi:hypothetical protein
VLGAQNFSAQETAEIYGVVKDNNGGTIPSATITIEGLNLRTQSDVNGK